MSEVRNEKFRRNVSFFLARGIFIQLFQIQFLPTELLESPPRRVGKNARRGD